MKRKKFCKILLCLACAPLLAACGDAAKKEQPAGIPSETDKAAETSAKEETKDVKGDDEDFTEAQSAETLAAPTLLYMGHASLRIVTGEGKVIYVDPYAGEGYDLAADLILVTHSHFDHTDTDKIKARSAECQVITWKEGLQNGEHRTFEFDFVTVEAVAAGYNRMHNERECVGYVLTFRNGTTLYVTGDTSMTPQMASLKDKGIDYAFYCCDGVYNMDLEEAARCAKLVGAKHDIPYHVVSTDSGKFFDRERAQKFDSPNLLVIDIGEELVME